MTVSTSSGHCKRESVDTEGRVNASQPLETATPGNVGSVGCLHVRVDCERELRMEPSVLYGFLGNNPVKILPEPGI